MYELVCQSKFKSRLRRSLFLSTRASSFTQSSAAAASTEGTKVSMCVYVRYRNEAHARKGRQGGGARKDRGARSRGGRGRGQACRSMSTCRRRFIVNSSIAIVFHARPMAQELWAVYLRAWLHAHSKIRLAHAINFTRTI